jgi:hypothetical protein
MSFDESLGLEIFDEERSRDTVIDFVQTHPGCIAQGIVDGQTEIARKKIFRILRDLKKERIIIKEKPKSKRRLRNKKLFVNRANPYTVVLNELREFEKIYFSILNKTINAHNNGRYLGDWEKPSYDPVVEDLAKAASAAALMWQPLHIFYGFMELYMFRLITNWSKEIRDKDVLQKVNNMIFAKFTQMRIDTYKIMNSVSDEVGSASIKISYVSLQMNTIDRLNENLKTLKKYDMEKEAKEFSEFMDKVIASEEKRSYFRTLKHKLYRYDSKYKKDDLKELAEDMVIKTTSMMAIILIHTINNTINHLLMKD